MVASMLWCVWKARIAAIFKHKPLDPSDVVETPLTTLRSFKKWSLSASKLGIEEENASGSWKPPKARTFKVNIDGAFVPGTTEGSIALVRCDFAGCLWHGATKSVAPASPLLVEAITLEDALNYVLSP